MTTTAPEKKKPVRAFDVILISVLGVLALITVYPFYNVLILSFSNIAAQAKHTPYMWFWALDLEGYKTIVGDRFFFLSLGNTLFVTIVGTAINMLLSVAGAYVLSKKRLPGRNFLLTLVVIPMLFSGGMIPKFLVVKGVGLYNTRMAVILPGVISTWNMIVMRTSFRAIPQSLEESARLDGAGDFTILFRIIVFVFVFRTFDKRNRIYDGFSNLNMRSWDYVLCYQTAFTQSCSGCSSGINGRLYGCHIACYRNSNQPALDESSFQKPYFCRLQHGISRFNGRNQSVCFNHS